MTNQHVGSVDDHYEHVLDNCWTFTVLLLYLAYIKNNIYLCIFNCRFIHVY